MKIERRRLGLVPFEEAWALQRELAARVTPDHGYLLLLEHPPVYTLGRNAKESNVLDPRGIPVVRIDRGGDVTYHGPGQLVGYLLRDLQKIGVRRHVRSLEDSILGLLGLLGVEGRRKGDCVGVWAAGGKIASIGVRVSRGVSMHGFALNVGGDLEPFGRINPCGIPRCAVTSVSRERGRAATVEEAAERFQLRSAGGVIRS